MQTISNFLFARNLLRQKKSPPNGRETPINDGKRNNREQWYSDNANITHGKSPFEEEKIKNL